MTLLSESALFDAHAVPLRVLETTTAQPTGAVTAEAVKVIFTMTGWTEVWSSENAIAASSGTILTVPAGLECWGVPHGQSRAITFYVHPDYLSDQVRWLAHTHPLVHQLRCAVAGDAGLQRLQVSTRAMRTMGAQLVRLAQLPHRREHEFAMLSIASDIFDSVGRFAGVAARPSADPGPTLGRPRDEVITAVDLMREHLGRDWRMDVLAREVALSTSQLICRGFLSRGQGEAPSGVFPDGASC